MRLKIKETNAFESHLGFFGHISSENGKIIKRYRGGVSEDAAGRLSLQHANFINNLRSIGIATPVTHIRFVPKHHKLSVEIEQEQFKKEELAGEIIKNGTWAEVSHITQGIIRDAILFIQSPFSKEMGFHPTVRNYAVREGKFYMLDTFPPFSDRITTEKIMRRHAPSLLFKLIMALSPFTLRKFSEEYYNSVEMIYGIYGTISRLRPEFEAQIRQLFLNISGANSELQSEIERKIEKEGFSQKLKWHLVQFLKSITDT